MDNKNFLANNLFQMAALAQNTLTAIQSGEGVGLTDEQKILFKEELKKGGHDKVISNSLSELNKKMNELTETISKVNSKK